MSATSFNHVQISRAALQHNYRLLQKKIGSGVRLLAMVKADAYGHGMEEAALSFAHAGCHDFGVAELTEGVRLRKSGLKGNILVFLGFDPADAALFFDFELTPVIFDLESAEVLSRVALQRNQKIAIQIKVDCGMSRLGVLPNDLRDVVKKIKGLPGVQLSGLCSHFPRADEADATHTAAQTSLFAELVKELAENEELTVHTANSGAILYCPESRFDMVRAGISLYGYYPDGHEGAKRAEGEKLRPAMSFSTRVLQVKTVPAGSGISYGHTFVTEHETTLAVLPVGYEDGFLRSLSGRAEVLVKGKRARVLGRVCMNLTMVDVTDILNVTAGDEVVILGAQGDEEIDGDEIAQWMNSISYEVLCLFGNTNERRYIT